MIKTTHLGKTFISEDRSVEALIDLNIDIPSGSIIGLIGPNGAGKTTTVRVLSTIYQPTTGGAIVAGYDILGEPLKVRQNVGVSTEMPSLYPRLSARRNLQFYADLYGMDKDKIERNKRMTELLKQFDLFDAQDRNTGTFSKGMKQKLSVCTALVHDPPVLIMDEPWSGLSPTAAKELREIIENLSKDDDRTILITTHNLAQAEKIVDKLLIINKGHLIENATPTELRSKYMMHYNVKIKFEKEPNLNGMADKLGYLYDIKLVENKIYSFEIDTFDNTPNLIDYVIKNDGNRIHSIEEVIPSLEEIYVNLVEE